MKVLRLLLAAAIAAPAAALYCETIADYMLHDIDVDVRGNPTTVTLGSGSYSWRMDDHLELGKDTSVEIPLHAVADDVVFVQLLTDGLENFSRVHVVNTAGELVADSLDNAHRGSVAHLSPVWNYVYVPFPRGEAVRSIYIERLAVRKVGVCYLTSRFGEPLLREIPRLHSDPPLALYTTSTKWVYESAATHTATGGVATETKVSTSTHRLVVPEHFWPVATTVTLEVANPTALTETSTITRRFTSTLTLVTPVTETSSYATTSTSTSTVTAVSTTTHTVSQTVVPSDF